LRRSGVVARSGGAARPKGWSGAPPNGATQRFALEEGLEQNQAEGTHTLHSPACTPPVISRQHLGSRGHFGLFASPRTCCGTMRQTSS